MTAPTRAPCASRCPRPRRRRSWSVAWCRPDPRPRPHPTAAASLPVRSANYRRGMAVREAVIVDTVRTPIGKRNGSLSGWHPNDLLACALKAVVDRSGVDPGLVDDVVTGCVSQVGEQSTNVGRNAWVAAGLPWHVPATTVDRQCGSSQQAVHFAAQGVIAGAYDIAIACGVEVMSRVPLASNAKGGSGPFSQDYLKATDGKLLTQFEVAQILADRFAITREEMDAFALESHRRAAAATDS